MPRFDNANTIPVNILRGITPTASAWDGQIGFAYYDDGGVFTDDTTDANDADAGDVALLPAAEAVGDAFYFGEGFATSNTFNAIKITISQGAAGDTLVWEYYNGASWVTLTPSLDETNLLATAGTGLYVKWDTPSDMGHVAVNGQDRYWVRIRVTAANITQQPLATQIWIGKYPESLTNATDGNSTTVATVGMAKASGVGNYGDLVFDMGSIKNVMVAAKIGIWASSGAVPFYVSYSDDNITYTSRTTLSATSSASSEQITHSVPSLGKGRYVRLTFQSTAAATINAKLYEVFAYEMGL